MSPWVWVVVALVVIALIVVIAVMANRKKQERNRAEAAELREKAVQDAADVQRREGLARETEAQAAAARAEADRKAAEAERLAAEAQERSHAADRRREEHQEQLRQADELDPDVRHAAPTTAAPEGGRHVALGAEGEQPAASDGHHMASGDGSPADGTDTYSEDETRTPGTHRA
jgi:hypothetical protein